ncbi:MAG: shikimate dehydrogenase [Ignavibacterium sp.]|nr:MAG: shikimate dehydrogenase [Ignavibacterium sp.]
MKNSFYTNTKLIGLLGHPIKQSYSPFIHNIAFQFRELDYIYLPFDVVTDDLENALNGIVALGMNGLNVTIPHKVKIIDYLDDLSEESSMIGAVNTITIEQGSLKGYNTDVHGILATLNQFKNEIIGEKVSIIGAGGGARASIFTLIRYFKPKEINIINRTLQRAETLQVYFYDKMRFEHLNSAELFPPDLIETLNSSKLIINASSVGMYPVTEDSPINLEEAFHKDQIVFDMVYNPTETKLLSLARMQGANVFGGLKMLVHQAAKSFELWTGEEMPIEKLSQSLEAMIKK